MEMQLGDTNNLNHYYSTYNILMCIMSLIIGVYCAFTNRYNPSSMYLGPWLNFIIILRIFLFCALFVWTSSISKSQHLMTIEIVAYVIASVCWRVYIARSVRQ